jgi:hypothetical protein
VLAARQSDRETAIGAENTGGAGAEHVRWRDVESPGCMGMTMFPRTARGWRSLRSHSGRVVASALVLSCLVHFVVLIATPVGEVGRAQEPGRRASPTSARSEALRIVLVAPPQPPASERAARPEIVAAITSSENDNRPRASPAGTPIAAQPSDSTREGDGGSRRAEGSVGNPLIWRGFSDLRLAAIPPGLSPEQALADELAQPKPHVSPLRACYDSINARAARARKAQDWTRRDRRGWRWGISADGIHIGPITVPIAPPPPPPGAVNWRPERDPCVDR